MSLITMLTRATAGIVNSSLNSSCLMVIWTFFISILNHHWTFLNFRPSKCEQSGQITGWCATWSDERWQLNMPSIEFDSTRWREIICCRSSCARKRVRNWPIFREIRALLESDRDACSRRDREAQWSDSVWVESCSVIWLITINLREFRDPCGRFNEGFCESIKLK